MSSSQAGPGAVYPAISMPIINCGHLFYDNMQLLYNGDAIPAIQKPDPIVPYGPAGVKPETAKKRNRFRFPFSEDLWRLLCVLFQIIRTILVFRLAGGAAGTAGAAAAIAPAARLSMLSANDGRCNDADHDRTGRKNDQDLVPGHFFSSRVAAASLSAAESVPAAAATASLASGCLLFQMTIATIAAAISTAKMKQVHHHSPMR